MGWSYMVSKSKDTVWTRHKSALPLTTASTLLSDLALQALLHVIYHDSVTKTQTEMGSSSSYPTGAPVFHP